MKFSFKLRQQDVTWNRLLSLWECGDELPIFTGGWVYDHFYPIFGDPAGPCMEGWTLLAGLSQRTERLRIGVMVSGNTYRHPAVLANMAATLDVMSAGRLEVGLGAGWNAEEHYAYGIPFETLSVRMDRLAEACEVIDLLLTEATATFSGRHYQLKDARCEPKPVQLPRPPLVIGGRGERRTLPIAARWADQWNFPSGSSAEFAHKRAVLHRQLDRIGRNRGAVETSAQVDGAQALTDGGQEIRSMASAGADHLICNLPPEADHQMLVRLADLLEGYES